MAESAPADAALDSGGAILRRRVAPMRLVIVDDHRLLAQMLVDRLAEGGHEALALDVADRRLVDRILELAPDLVILDAVFHDREDAGLEVLRHLVARDGDLRVVMLTGVVDALRHAVFLAEGATAVISKADSFDTVAGGIADVIAGRDPMGHARREDLRRVLAAEREAAASRAGVLARLTPSEMATLQGLVDGRSVHDMAARRTVAVSTVRSHVRAILRKLGAHSQVEAIAIAAKAGVEPVGGEASAVRR